MSRLTGKPGVISTGWYDDADCNLDDFKAVLDGDTVIEDYPHADHVVENVLVYDGADSGQARRSVQAELARALLDGPGIVVFKRAFDPAVVDSATAAFDRLIAAQKTEGSARGDHFANPGANDRVWGAFDKLAVAEPDVFVSYYANDVLALISQAWLGPNYQVTSQVNVVNPGGQAQVPHRDYHLGFMDLAQASAYPAQVHALSPALTLQGAVAHVDMPVETGPTLYLPHSQKYTRGYLAFHDPAFTAYFAEHSVQLPLEKGDAVFFNPALFHGAGTNRTSDVARMANLLQVSSAFGRAMETVDTTAICKAIFATVLRWVGDGPPERLVGNLVAAAAEGYPFPTNLDFDQPVGALTPPSQAELFRKAIDERWEPAQLVEQLDAQQQRRRSLP